MRTLGIGFVLLILVVAPPPADADTSCLEADKTGMAWAHPFAEALETSKANKRILMIKPVAFGTTPDGGW